MAEQNREEFLCVHEDVVNKVMAQMPPEETLYDLAELFKVFGDSTRIQILFVPKHHRAEKWRSFWVLARRRCHIS